jgi:hypothetical protein
MRFSMLPPIRSCLKSLSTIVAHSRYNAAFAPEPAHHLFLGAWRAGYPLARLYAAPGLRHRRTDLAFDGQLGDAPEPEWGGEIDQVLMLGSFALTNTQRTMD